MDAPNSLHESAQAIVNAALHMRSLVSKLIGKPDLLQPKPVLTTESVSIRAMLNTARKRYEPLAQSKNQSLWFRSKSDVGFVEGDGEAIERVINNLLSNAIKYTPIGGQIQIKAHRQENVVSFEVLDTGPGLSPSDLEHIFLYSQRLSASPTQGEEQHGLGLVSVRRLVNAMGGRVFAENRLRTGARFVVELMAANPL